MKIFKLPIGFIICIFLFSACDTGQEPKTVSNIRYDFPFQDPTLSLDERLNDLVERMTLEEKMGQLIYRAPAIERLGIPAYNWWNECLHGVARNGKATIFPQAIGMAATFDTELIHEISSVIAVEARAKYNVSSAREAGKQYQGLTFWTPNINIFRDPRWGRGHETYGEDPYLTSRMGTAFVRGLQGDDPDHIKAAGCAKHFAVHSGPEGLRHEFNAVASMKDMWETYLPAFEALVTEAGVAGVMGAYNRTNGDPCNAHPYLMQEVLRGKWGFQGYYVTDCWAVRDFFEGHKVVETAAQAAALALKSGANLNCGNTYEHLMEAFDQGLITEQDVDRNVRELFPTRFKLGLLDKRGTSPFDSIGPDKIRHPDHIQLSRKAARKSVVMLKNNNNLLPLSKDLNTIFVTGPTAAHVQALLANYYGVGEELVTLVEGIVGAVGDTTKIDYVQGGLLDRPNNNPIDWYSGNAAGADVTIVCLGISQLIEGEEGEAIASDYKGDRLKDIRLPQNQLNFLKKIRSQGEKIVVVITGGSAISIPEVYKLADAVLFVWYPGEQGGHAVADIIFGDISPSGRLPVTFPQSIDDLPPYEQYDMKGRTYRYLEKPPLFPFGFGLSYVNFAYSDIELNKSSIQSGETVQASVVVTNEGTMEAEEVVQLYIKDVEASVEVPRYSLKGFKRITLAPGAAQEVSFTINQDMLSLIDNDGNKQLEPGIFQIFLGGNSPDARNQALGATIPKRASLMVN